MVLVIFLEKKTQTWNSLSSKWLGLALWIFMKFRSRMTSFCITWYMVISSLLKIWIIQSWYNITFKLLVYEVKACIAGVVRERIWWQIWIQYGEKPPCSNFWSNRGSQWHLTAYCDFFYWWHVQVIFDSGSIKLYVYERFEFHFLSLSHYFEKVFVQYHFWRI